MCDYSLHNVASRPAKIGDRLVTSDFAGSTSQGFAAIAEPNMAVCLLPGTEIAFDRHIRQKGFFFARNTSQNTAIFRHINQHEPATHHDAVELVDGTTILLNELCPGQCATVLQLPARPHREYAMKETDSEFATF